MADITLELSFETDRKMLKLISSTDYYPCTPPCNLLWQQVTTDEEREALHKADLQLSSWRMHLCLTKVFHGKETTKEKIAYISKSLGAKPLGRKNLGSENRRNAVWVFRIEDVLYYLYYSIKGMSIEVERGSCVEQVTTHLNHLFSLLVTEKYDG